MENLVMLRKPRSAAGKFDMQKLSGKLVKQENSRQNPLLSNLCSENGEGFFQYLQMMELSQEPKTMILSSMNHYFYDSQDLKDVKTLVTLKKLNSIKFLDRFLGTVVRMLPSKSCFVGYFKKDYPERKGFMYFNTANMLNVLKNYIDSRTYNNFSKMDVSDLLKKHNMEIVDFSDYKGMTYFCSRTK